IPPPPTGRSHCGCAGSRQKPPETQVAPDAAHLAPVERHRLPSWFRPQRPVLPSLSQLQLGSYHPVSSLPNPASVLGNHGLSGLASKRLLEAGRILHRPIHAPAPWRMRIDQYPPPRFRIGHVLAPDLPVCKKVPLRRSVSIDGLHGRVADDLVQRHVSQFQSSVVGGIFTQRQFAIKLNLTLVVLHGNKARILVGSAIRALFKFFGIVCGPPIAEIPIRIKLAPLVVEAVRKLMPDHHSDRAKVHRVIHLLAEKRWLQNARRKIDIVHRSAIVGVYRRRSHPPILAVRWPVDLLVLALHLKRAR